MPSRQRLSAGQRCLHRKPARRANQMAPCAPMCPSEHLRHACKRLSNDVQHQRRVPGGKSASTRGPPLDTWRSADIRRRQDSSVDSATGTGGTGGSGSGGIGWRRIGATGAARAQWYPVAAAPAAGPVGDRWRGRRGNRRKRRRDGQRRAVGRRHRGHRRRCGRRWCSGEARAAQWSATINDRYPPADASGDAAERVHCGDARCGATQAPRHASVDGCSKWGRENSLRWPQNQTGNALMAAWGALCRPAVRTAREFCSDQHAVARRR
jgi:hypothetical protein